MLRSYFSMLKLVALIAIAVSSIFFGADAAAIEFDKPSMLEGAGDTGEADDVVEKVLKFGLWVVASLALVVFLWGLGQSLGFVGEREKGVETMKWSGIVLVICASIGTFFGFLGTLFG